MKAVPVLAAVLLASSPARATDPATQLAEVAASVGFPVNASQTKVAMNDGVTAVVSSIAGFEYIPAGGFIQGANIGFMFLDMPGSNIPTGYYRVNAQAAGSSIHVGQYSGTVRLINLQGVTVTTLPANFQTSSLQVPQPLPFPQTTVDVTITSRISAPKFRTKTVTCFEVCPNGTIISYQVTVTTFEP